MRKIAITGVTAALALGLTACDGDGGGKTAAAPQPANTASAPSENATASAPTTPGAPSAPGASSTPSTPRGADGTGAPAARHTPLGHPGGRQIKSTWGRLRYLAPGKFTVGNVAFFTSNDTVLYVAGSTCPDGSTPPDVSRCSISGFEEWVKAAPHNATVRFSGQAATLIRETQ